MNLFLWWLLGGLFLSMLQRFTTHKEQSMLTYLFILLLWPLVPIGMVLYLVLIILAGMVLVLNRMRV